MVLHKRKPVKFPPQQEIYDDNVEVWHIPETGEVFTTYDEYLNRIDFYHQKKFNCQISGRSGMTFFEALKSERAGAEEVEQAFPEALKGPVLRRVQFQTISRIDALVDMVYEEFKADYYPGESVTVHMADGERLTGVVREKTRLGSKQLPDGTWTRPFTRYFVCLDNRISEEAVVEDEHIWRERKVFTKAVLRSFIKKTVLRDAWNGAPWLVRHDYAAMYHIDTRVPPHLSFDTKQLERKHLAAQKKALQPGDPNGMALGPGSGPARLPELKPMPKGQKKLPLQPLQAPKGRNHFGGGESNGVLQAPAAYQFPVSLRNPPPMAPPYAPPEPPPPPPPPKYPIEDLQVEPRDGSARPALKFMCSDPPVPADRTGPLDDQILMKSVGPLLETWDTLNVYCEVFQLDSFTFDDFVEVMCVASEEVPVELFSEIHCSVLKILVDSEADGGEVHISLPEIEEDDEDEEEEEEEDSVEATATPEPEPRRSGRATRSSLAKLEAERLAAEAAAAEKDAEPEIKHRAEEVLADFDWIESLRKRQFADGGWERIVVGLLHQLSKDERYTESCEELLAQLAPIEVEEPTQETVRQQYASLDVNYRVQALQILCMLTTETKGVRGYMENCSEVMTKYRKDKIDWQRQRKQAIADLQALNDQRKILLPDNMPPSPPPEPVKGDDEDLKMPDAEESVPDSNEEDTDDDVHSRRRRRPTNDRAADRQKKRAEELKRKEEAEIAAKAPKQSKQFLKLLKDIQKKEDLIKQCEDEIAVIDNDLREADCPRTRVLGKDRFWNRYYWFERNGMPYEGLPTSSTADAGYANGCIWIQGPDELEREGYIDLAPEYQKEYVAKFGMTVPERKKQEEGATSVYNAYQWGYICEPDDVDALLLWLDPRGFNEMKLRKEIIAFKDKIIRNMENRKTHLDSTGAAGEEEGGGKKEAKRMSTRTRTHQTPEPPASRCLRWTNTTALEELGHLHSEPPPPPRARKQTRKREALADHYSAPATKSRRR